MNRFFNTSASVRDNFQQAPSAELTQLRSQAASRQRDMDRYNRRADDMLREMDSVLKQYK